MKPRTILIIVVAAILVVAAFTVLNKAWWAERINRKFNLQQPLTPNGTFVRSQSLRALITLYTHGTFVDGELAVANPPKP